MFETTLLFISGFAILIKFFYGKVLISKTRTILKSYFRWFSVYDFADACTNELKTFYRTSNISNFIIWSSLCILLLYEINTLINS